MDVLVSYDIADTQGKGARRLRRVAQVCEKYGERVQFSVFECRLSPSRLERMLGEVEDVIDPGRDSVIVYRFRGGFEAVRMRLGLRPSREPGDPWMV